MGDRHHRPNLRKGGQEPDFQFENRGLWGILKGVHSSLTGQTEATLQDFYSGKKVLGNDFTPEQIREWYSLEENACFEIYEHGKKRMPNNDWLHWSCGFRWALSQRHSLGKVLGLGSGNAEEFRPIEKWIEHLYIVESAEGYFQDGKTITYKKARPDGVLDFPDEFFDTQAAIAVLHHIPNISSVLRELFRTLKRGGVCLIKEPITSLGPWHLPRKRGLAPCERGFPQKWLQDELETIGFHMIHKTLFEFPPLRHLRDRFGVDTYNSKFWVWIDQVACQCLGWNYRYYRRRWLEKLAPSYAFFVCRKPDA